MKVREWMEKAVKAGAKIAVVYEGDKVHLRKIIYTTLGTPVGAYIVKPLGSGETLEKAYADARKRGKIPRPARKRAARKTAEGAPKRTRTPRATPPAETSAAADFRVE